jgi:hypothetical protein
MYLTDMTSNELCDCKNYFDKINYYLDMYTGKCHVCPKECKCSKNGCYDCKSNTLRYISKITTSQQIHYRCPCLQNTF